MIITIAVFTEFNSAAENALLNEKSLDKQMGIKMISELEDRFIEQDDDWEEEYEFYEEMLIFSVEMIDAQENTFAAVYDTKLNRLSKYDEAYSGESFMPENIEEFRNTVLNNENGWLTIDFKPIGENIRSMRVYYQWIPSSNELVGRFLAVTAVSIHAVQNRALDRIDYGVIGIILLTTILNIIMIYYLVKVRNDKRSTL
jgi:hypothetical protein